METMSGSHIHKHQPSGRPSDLLTSLRRALPLSASRTASFMSAQHKHSNLPRSVHRLPEYRAQNALDRIFLAQRRRNGEWETITYDGASRRVCRLAAGLVKLGLSPTRPIMILSGNSIEHGLLALAARSCLQLAPLATGVLAAQCTLTTHKLDIQPRVGADR